MKKILLSTIILLNGAAFAVDPSMQCCIPYEKPFPAIQNCRDYNLMGFGEFIYWRFSAPTFAYARSGVDDAGVTETGTAFLPNFKYNPGFRVGVEIKYGAKKAFDLVAQYTWLYSNPHSSISGSPIGNAFTPDNFLNSPTLDTNTYTFASLKLNLHFNYAEIQSGYSFPINRYFALRPFIALTSYIFEGDLRAQYEFTSTPAPDTFEIAKTHGKFNSWSIGPKTGLDVIYHITENWGIFSNFNITQQITNITAKSIQITETPATGESIIVQNGRLQQLRNIGLFGLEIGPTWDEWFCCDKYHVYVRATYGASTLTAGANLSFLNSSNLDLGVNGEFRGLNVRGLFEF